MSYAIWVVFGALLGLGLGLLSGDVVLLVLLGGAVGLASAVSFRQRRNS